MISKILKIFCLLLCVCLFWQMRPSLELKSVETHLDKFSKYNVTHHDNIDDEAQKHAHKHKHGQDGEEHEHNHDHTKVTQNEIKVLSTPYQIVNRSVEVKSKNYFFEKTLISSPHPFGIFRPPIS